MEPLKNTTDDPRIRLLNRLYAKKRKELKERDKLKVNWFFLPCFIFIFYIFLICWLIFWFCNVHFDMNFHCKPNANYTFILTTWDFYIDNDGHILQIVEIEEDRVDDRSVDDLLSFINGGGGISGCWFFCAIDLNSCCSIEQLVLHE